MIDLSDAKVGDEFVDNHNGRHLVVLVGIKDIVTISNYPEGDYHASFRKDSGKEVETDGDCALVSKIDPNAWWKDLPPAEWFELINANMILCEGGTNKWTAHAASEPHCIPVNINVIPRRSAAIKISDLKKWQEEQK